METWETLTMSRKEVPRAGLLTAHRRAFPPSQGPHRALLANPAGPPRERVASARHRTLEAANAFLPAFLADLNTRFAWPPADPRGAWRPAPRDLAAGLSCRYTRRVAHDNTVRLGPRWVQLPRRRSYAGRRVELRECLDGRLLVFADGACLATQPAPPAFILRPRRSPNGDRPRRPRPASVRTQWERDGL